MTTRTLLDIVRNRVKANVLNPTEAQFFAEICKALEKLDELEREQEKENEAR